MKTNPRIISNISDSLFNIYSDKLYVIFLKSPRNDSREFGNNYDF